MNFLRKLFRRKEEESVQVAEPKKPPQAAVPGRLDGTTATGIKTMLRAHLKRLESAYEGHPGSEDLHRLCDQLLADDQLAFVVKSIQDNLPGALANKTRYDTTQLFTTSLGESAFFVAVTVFPWLTPAEVRAHLRGGYSNQLVELGAKVAVLDHRSPAEEALGILPWTHLVHWIYCCDGKNAGVHLSLMPEAANTKAKRTVTIIAEDLLTPDERKKMGLSHLA